MARPKKLKISALHLHSVIRHLKKAEINNPSLMIGDKAISEILIEISDFDLADASIEVEVKKIIMEVDGDGDPDASLLPNDKEMSDFNFSDIQLIDLTDEFNKIAKKRNARAKISISKVKACEEVSDCVGLVTKASSK